MWFLSSHRRQQKAPLNRDVDIAVALHLEPMRVVYNLPLIMRVASFFDPTAVNADASTELVLLVENTEVIAKLRSLRKQVYQNDNRRFRSILTCCPSLIRCVRMQTEQRILMAIENQSTIAVDIDLNAPRLIGSCSRFAQQQSFF
jgi:hypothetical protein